MTTSPHHHIIPSPHDHPRIGCALSNLVTLADHLLQIRKADMRTGDWVFVKTLRSLYRIQVLENAHYQVSGGWFDKKGMSPASVTISGCTWGGSVIKIDIVAACGMRLEFGNRVITSPIQRIVVFKNWSAN